MAYCAAVFCCVQKLKHRGSNQHDDLTKVVDDYHMVVNLFTTVLEQTTTEQFWERGPAISRDSFDSSVVQFFNQAWYPYALNNVLKSKKLAKVMYYSGHGVPDTAGLEGAKTLSPIPKANFAVLKELTAEEVGPLTRGDWPLHHTGFLGVKCLILTALKGLNAMDTGSEKELLIIADCCFSGNWCDVLRDSINDFNIPINCFITIQAATSASQCAHAGIFTPVLCNLQYPETRDKWLKEFCDDHDFEDVKAAYGDYLELQSPVFFSTRENVADNTTDRIVCVKNLNSTDTSFYLFRCPVFFWFCAEHMNLIGVLDECNYKANTSMKCAERDAMYSLLAASGLTTNLKILKKFRGKHNKATNTCENTYMPIMTVPSENIEIHVHYNDKTGGPVKIGEVTFKQIVGGKVMTAIGAKKLGYNSMAAAMKAKWNALISGLLTAATAGMDLTIEANWVQVGPLKSFTFEELKESDDLRKDFSWFTEEKVDHGDNDVVL